ncbi:MAG: PfkB family carbohydrate kinase, partial [Thermoanaerobaculia bacterium]
MKPAVVTVTLNPAIDQTLSIPGFAVGQVNRVVESRSDAGGKGVNVASFLADLGVEVIATGFLGFDNDAPFDNLFLRKP